MLGRGGETVDAPPCSHTLLDTATQMWFFVNDCLQDFTQSNSSTPVTQYIVSQSPVILVAFSIKIIS